MKFSIFLVLFTLIACNVSNSNELNSVNDKLNAEKDRISDYDLTKPDVILTLPDTLREVSGLTDIDNSTIACVQDENGILFIYDLDKNCIKHQFSFNIDGDYEGITRVHNAMYILRSDGILIEISNYLKPNYKIHSYETGIPANDNEGLCYDPFNNRLLIASKGKIAKGPQLKNKRAIYGFDLKTKKLAEEPAFDFDLEKIKTHVIDHEIEVPFKVSEKKGVTSKEPFIKFMTSAVSVHPKTKQLYLLSAADYLFFIFNMKGEIEHVEHLDPKVFNKAEGITFLDNNEMIITNEGQDGKPTLLRFKYKKRHH